MKTIDAIIEDRKRLRYRRAMLKAIKTTSKGGLFRACNKAGGLRAIRLFEKLNNIKFDPFNNYHISHMKGKGAIGASIRAVKISLSRINSASQQGK